MTFNRFQVFFSDFLLRRKRRQVPVYLLSAFPLKVLLIVWLLKSSCHHPRKTWAVLCHQNTLQKNGVFKKKK